MPSPSAASMEPTAMEAASAKSSSMKAAATHAAEAARAACETTHAFAGPPA